MTRSLDPSQQDLAKPPGRKPEMHELQLADWRRAIGELYTGVRRSADPRAAWERWRAERDRLYKGHPQSPIPPGQRSSFQGLSYFDYDPAYRFRLELTPSPAQSYEVSSSDTSSHTFTRFALAPLEISGQAAQLEIYWLEGYSGGIFLPFQDAGGGRSTYGGGRYLLDTAKGADLGLDDGRLVVDFNFAYQPSCSYDPKWVCPLAPEANRLPIDIPAGERLAGSVGRVFA